MDKSIQNSARYTTLSVEDVLAQLQSADAGLTVTQVTERLEQYGSNEIPHHGISWWSMIMDQCKSPWMVLLFFAAMISFFLGNHIEGLVIIVILLINILLGFYQEYKAEKTARMLKQFLTAQVKVMRDGIEQEIPTKNLVPGDIVVLYPGDILAADMRIIHASNCTIDESVLTGEGIPVKKQSEALPQESQELFTAYNIGFAGTTVLTGRSLAVVLATGSSSSLGILALESAQTVRASSITRIIDRLSSFILYLTLISLAIIIAVHVIIKPEVDYLELILFASALAISAVPEALPLITVFSLSKGAQRLAHNKTVVKRLSALEDLGNIEILCTDKTGTLTENVLSVTGIYGSDERQTIIYAALVSGVIGGDKRATVKGFDSAIVAHLLPQEQQQLQEYERLGVLPFDPSRLRSLALVRKGTTYSLVIRGAVEWVVERCPGITQAEKEAIAAWIAQEGKRGNRVLAVGIKELAPQEGKSYEVSSADDQQQLQFIGMVSFADPLKESAHAAVQKAKELGLELKVLSGDSKEVCAWVAQQLGLITDATQVITGAEFGAKNEAEQLAIAQKYTVFARVSPEHKHAIIKLLQKTKDVGYMGDGINDVLALKEAQVGLAIYDAVDVAREAADIIILQKSLMIVIDGIQEGRKVFANVLKYLRLTMAVNFGNFYSIGIAALVLDFLPMLPVQLLLVNLLTDIPLIALATDTVAQDELKRPAKYDVKGILLLSTFLGLVSSVFDFVYFALFWRGNHAVFQTGWFILNVCTEMLFLFSMRTNKVFYKAVRPSWAVILLALLSVTLSLMLPYVYAGHKLFGFVFVPLYNVLIVLGISVVYFIASEIIKIVYHRIIDTRAQKNNGTI